MPVGTNRYADYDDMQRIFPTIVDFFLSAPQGTIDARTYLIAATNRINQFLQSLPFIETIPLATTSSGDYDQNIKDLCCYLAIHERVWGKLMQQLPEKPLWIADFYERGTGMMRDIVDGNLILEIGIGAAEKGIGEPAKGATNSGQALFFTNFDGYFGRLTDASHKRSWILQIDATTSGNNIGQATYKWSMDNGFTWEEETITTGTDWDNLAYNVHIRFQHGTGTANQLNFGDRWTWTTVPERLKQKQHGNYAASYEFEMGS